MVNKIILPMVLSSYHKPVLVKECIDLLNINKNKVYIDATIGGGGHTQEIINRGGIVLGIDADSDAIKFLQTQQKINIDKGTLKLFNGNFSELEIIIKESGTKKIAGIIFDLGLSSNQIDRSERGFSFSKKENLDMRFNKHQKLNALTVINEYKKEELYEIFSKNSEELNSWTIANAIFRARSLTGKISTTGELNNIIKQALGSNNLEVNRVMARIYQAIRMEVNRESVSLEKGINSGIEYLDKNGRIVVLSYHSLEDRMIKQIFNNAMRSNKLKVLTKKPITADFSEIKVNSRSRSAKLRAAEKI